MTESRFLPPERETRHCLSCEHQGWAGKDIVCNHPERPPQLTPQVVKWYGGCPQHTPT